MTEIALALAMGFFSLMVLTLISMGADDGKAMKSDTLDLAPLAESHSASASNIGKDDLILIFDGKTFLDKNMNAVDPEHFIATHVTDSKRVILALDPSLPLNRAIMARGLVKAENLIVSSLDKAWMEALKNKGDFK